jgi:hypothetical protein
MKEDLSLIRNVLLKVEAANGTVSFDCKTESEEFVYNAKCAIDRGLLTGKFNLNSARKPTEVFMLEITPSGNDALNALRNEYIFKDTLTQLDRAHAFTFDRAIEIALEVGEIRRKEQNKIGRGEDTY